MALGPRERRCGILGRGANSVHIALAAVERASGRRSSGASLLPSATPQDPGDDQAEKCSASDLNGVGLS